MRDTDSMQIFEKREFECFYDRNSGRIFSDLEFRKCHFVSCGISITEDPRLRSTVRNVKLVDCERHGCTLHTAIVENVLVDGLKTNGLFQTWGAVFKHVTLRGKLGRIMISPAVAAGTVTEKEQRAFDEANAAYYQSADWALDISEAEFEEADIRGIRATLIRRDPVSQVVVTREKAMEGRWRTLPLQGTDWDGILDLFLRSGEPDTVLVAPKRHRKFRNLLEGLRKLRDAGVAEPE